MRKQLKSKRKRMFVLVLVVYFSEEHKNLNPEYNSVKRQRVMFFSKEFGNVWRCENRIKAK